MAADPGCRKFLAAAVVIGCLCAGPARAGSFADSAFSGGNSDSCYFNIGLTLSIRDTNKMRMEYLDVHTPHSSTPQTPDVAVLKNKKFRFFWSDTAGAPVLYYLDETVNDTGIDSGNNVAVSDTKQFIKPVFLHADAVDSNNFFVSIIDKTNGFRFLGYAGKPKSRIESIGDSLTSTLHGSQCHFADNVYLAVYEKSSDSIFYSSLSLNSAIPSISTQVITVVARGQFPCINPSIAADAAGNVLVLWGKGSNSGLKTLSYAFKGSSETTFQNPAIFPDNISDVGIWNGYDAAPVISYGTGKFAAVSWNSGGITLRLFENKTGNSVGASSYPVVSRSNCRQPTISFNDRNLSILWVEGSVNSPLAINGVQYKIENTGDINFSAVKNFDPIPLAATRIDSNVVVFNSAMDSSGNMGLCLEINHSARMGIVTSRNLYCTSGSWTSPPLPIQQGFIDSVYFDAGTIIGSNSGPQGSIQGALGVSVSGNAASFTSFDSSAVMKTRTKGLYKYVQYKINLQSSSNRLKTPTVRKISLHWNAKPRFDSLVTVRVGKASPNTVKFGDTITCRSRLDSVNCRFSMFDADSSDTLYPTIQWRSATFKDTLRGFSDRSSSFAIAPIDSSDSVIACRFTARDAGNWAAQDGVIYVKTVNVVPVLLVRAVHNHNPHDTLNIVGSAAINVQQSDFIEFFYSMVDTNDTSIQSNVLKNGTLAESSPQKFEKLYTFLCSEGRPQGDEFQFIARDPDTAVIIRVICGVNHYPVIDSVSVDGKTVQDGDTVLLIPGTSHPLLAHGFDADIGYFDTLTFVFASGGRSTVSKDSAFTYTPGRFDTAMKIVTYDRYGIRDSLRFFLKFPWYANDSLENPGPYLARSALKSVFQVIGDNARDTVPISIKNTGNAPLTIVSLRFLGNNRKWLSMLVPKAGALEFYTQPDSNLFFPLPCPPDSQVRLYAIFTSDSLTGDGFVYDTIVMGLNDGIKVCDTFPVRLEYNDLPRIMSCSVQFTKDKPYWLAKKKIRSGSPAQQFTFPPFAKISLSFSEAMDSVSALGAIKAYSLFDLSAHDSSPIPLGFTWAQGKTRVDCSPRYSRNSTYFNMTPLPGFFIPTDSIRLLVTSSITDTARTPHGPNGLDVHGLGKRSAADTSFSFRVDSVTFTVTSTIPGNAAQDAAPATPIIVIFSSAPLPGTIDTGRIGNRMLIVQSSFHTSPISFSRIYVSGDSIVFFPAKRFFYGDTVRCRYRSMWARDSSGYSADVSKNGIPLSMFDTSSAQDDKEWFFTVKYIGHAAIFPANGSVDIAPKTPIRVTLTDTAPAAAVDMSLRDNRALILTSRCGGENGIGFDSIRISGTMVAFYPAVKFYYGDSVFCSYRGLTTDDTGRYWFDADKGPIFTKDTIHWSFSIKPIKLVSAVPESASASSSIHPEITLRFSEPVYSGTFDSDTSHQNRSIRFTSTYSRDSAISFKAIAFSPDDKTISVRPNGTYFNSDSLHVAFIGFNKDIAYGNAENLPGTGPFICGKQWHFFVRTEEFYTYPNPYKPGSDPRHCTAQGPCGIWFKNLHVLKSGSSEVSITIFSMNAHPLFSTKAAGVQIRFESRNPDLRPEWKWDTRNQHGDFVASGLYLYAIYDTDGKVIFKGKLMIVR